MSSLGAFSIKAGQGVIGMTMAVSGGTSFSNSFSDRGADRCIVRHFVARDRGGAGEALRDVVGEARFLLAIQRAEALPDFRALQDAVALKIVRLFAIKDD